jgi:hypothetical protein
MGDYFIDPKCIEEGGEIGRGGFGIIWAGLMRRGAETRKVSYSI